MSQEYTEDKEVKLTKLSSRRRLLEASLILCSLFAVWLMVALLSFNPSDPSWSQTAWHEPIHNIGGIPGAWLADTLFFIFGIMAYTIPLIIIGSCWFAWRHQVKDEYIDYFAVALRLIGALALVITSCGLAAINADDIWYFASGGVIGSLLSTTLQPLLHSSGGTIILLCIWAAGLTLFTGWSWVTIAEKIGSVVLSVLTIASRRGRQEESAVESGNESDAISPGHSRSQLLRSVLMRRQDLADKFSNPVGNNTDAALFSGKRMDDPEEDIPFNTHVTPATDDDVLFSGASIVDVAQNSDTPLSGTTATPADKPDALFNEFNFATSEKTSDETAAPYIWQDPLTDQAATSRQAEPTQPPASSSEEPIPLYQSESVPQTAQPMRLYMSSSSEIKATAEAMTNEAKPQRPPLYYFEEVEEKRAREHEQMAAWYQPIPEPDSAQVTQSVTSDPFSSTNTVTETSAVAADIPQTKAVNSSERIVSTTSAAPMSSASPMSISASDKPRAQVKEGIGPKLPPAKHVHVPTRRELASYGIKLPSQRMAEERARQSEMAESDDESRSADEVINVQEQSELIFPFSAAQSSRDSSEQSSSDSAPLASATDEVSEPLLRSQSDSQQEISHAQTEIQSEPLIQPEQPSPQAEVQSSSAVETSLQQNAAKGVSSVETSPQDEESSAGQESLIHPLLMRNGDNRPLPKPTTPLPSLDLLAQPPATVEPVDTFELEKMARLVEARLADFRIKADVVHYSPGPVITRFELNLAPGVKASRISNLSRDLARSLSTVAVRIVEVIPGKPYVGLELPNKKRQTVYLREVLDNAKFRDSTSPLTVVLGKDIAGEPVVADLAKMPHLLVAGTTGSGKSVGVNAMILSILYKAQPEDVRFIMIDPKMLELSVYEGIPHLLTEVVTDMKDAANALRWSVNEMERRYKLMSALGVRNLAGYNEKIAEAARMGRPIPNPYWRPGDSMETVHPVLEKLPFIVVVVDEFADLMMTVGKKVEELIARLAQKARAAGIHLVLATQRPSVDVITGLIKANIPTRIAFTVSSKIDSRTILDQGGAESLLGMGDMLYAGPGSTMPVRVHGAFVRDEEVHAVVQDWKARGRPQYVDGITSDSDSENGGSFDSGEELDPLFDQAVSFVTEKRKASISGVQRQFRIGYNRAARIIEQMEMQGIVSVPGNNGNREVLAPPSGS